MNRKVLKEESMDELVHHLSIDLEDLPVGVYDGEICFLDGTIDPEVEEEVLSAINVEGGTVTGRGTDSKYGYPVIYFEGDDGSASVGSDEVVEDDDDDYVEQEIHLTNKTYFNVYEAGRFGKFDRIVCHYGSTSLNEFTLEDALADPVQITDEIVERVVKCSTRNNTPEDAEVLINAIEAKGGIEVIAQRLMDAFYNHENLAEDAKDDIASYKKLRDRTDRQEAKLDAKRANRPQAGVVTIADLIKLEVTPEDRYNSQRVECFASNGCNYYDFTAEDLENDQVQVLSNIVGYALVAKKSSVTLADVAAIVDDIEAKGGIEAIVKEIVDAFDKREADNSNYKLAKSGRDIRVLHAKAKAIQSMYDEAPELQENDYAIWHSKNGERKVTIVKIDEPNDRAKINTDKGATMYVPLDALSKDVDYSELNS